MGLRIKAGDGSGTATLLDVQDSAGTTTHFAVRKNGISVLGEATASTAFTAPNTPKAWATLSWNGTSASVLAGYNVSSVTRSGGVLTVTFPSGVFTDANYCVVCTSAMDNTSDIVRPVGVGSTRTTTSCEIICTGIGGTNSLVQTAAGAPHSTVYVVFYR